jgi:hypothetical protein
MNATIEQINRLGYAFVEFALPMLIQSGQPPVQCLAASMAMNTPGVTHATSASTLSQRTT